MAWYRSCKKQSGEVIIAQLNDILTGPDSTKATASSTSQDGAIWKVFDGIKSGSEQDCWIPEYGSTNCWVCYQFSSPKNVTMCRVYFYQNMDGTYAGSIVIQGSNDGTNWTNISNSVSLNMNRGIHDYEIQTDSTTQYTYIRMFSADPLVVYGSPSACTLEFEIYGYSGGGGNTVPQMIPVANYHGSNSSVPFVYTVLEDGLYLIVTSNGYTGVRSVTLPQNRTAIINQDVAPVGDSRGALVVAANLQTNDEVEIISGHGGGWQQNGCIIFLLKNITLTTVYDTEAISDNTLTYDLPLDNNYYLSLGVCMGGGISNFYDSIVDTSAPLLKENFLIGQNTEFVAYLETGNSTPQLSMYGYDGGGVCYCIINATI